MSANRIVQLIALSWVSLSGYSLVYAKQSTNCLGPNCHDVRIWQKTDLQHRYYVTRSTGSLLHDTEDYVIHTAMQQGKSKPVMTIHLRNTHQPCCTGRYFHVPYMRGVNVEMSTSGFGGKTVSLCALRNNFKPAEANLSIQLAKGKVKVTLSQMPQAAACDQWYESVKWANYKSGSIEQAMLYSPGWPL